MQTVTPLILEYGILIVFLNVFLEQAGIPLPTYPTLMTAGALAVSGGAGLPLIFLIVLVAAAAADLSWYFAGTRHGNKVLRLLCKMSLSTDSCVHHTEAAFERIGPRALLVTKYLPGIGPVAVALAGAVGMRLGLFIILDMGGALLYFGPPILLGHFFHGALGPILEWMATLGLYTLIVFAGLVAIWLVCITANAWPGRMWRPFSPQEENYPIATTTLGAERLTKKASETPDD